MLPGHRPARLGHRLTIGLASADDVFLGIRCAGLVDADIAAALASRTVALSRIPRGGTIDPRSHRWFSRM
jgi:hypothetical protein